MNEQITVFVNETAVLLYRGMKVKHALIAHNYVLYEACSEGKATVQDEDGFLVGLEGALHEGSRLTVKRSG